MNLALSLLVVLTIGLGAPRLAAQLTPLSLELSVGGGVPVGAFTEGPVQGGDLGPGPAFGVHFNFTSATGRILSLGFRQLRFSCSDDGCPGSGEYVATDWDVGLRFRRGTEGLTPWLGAGAIFTRVERDFQGGAGSETALSDLSVGGEIAAGLLFSLGGRFSVDPTLRYVAVNTRFPERHLLRMRYLMGELGVVIGF